MKPKGPKAKKELGQHFLVNQATQLRIIEHCNLQENDHVVEIGPGKGALTQHLIDVAQHTTAIEKDTEMVEYLNSTIAGNKLTIINEDVLQYSFNDIQEKSILIGNLPYNISTPIIEHLIKYKDKFSRLFITVQLEYARRLAAHTHTKDYGALTCFAQYHFQIKKLFNINKTSFFPIPKVQSAFVQLIPKQTANSKIDEKHLFRVIHFAFSQRRKTMLNALSSVFEKEKIMVVLKKNGLKEKVRAEEVQLDQFIDISNDLKTYNH